MKLHLEYWRSWDVRDIKDSDVNVGYLNWLKERPEYAGKNHLKTVKNVFVHFRVFHNWCIDEHLVPPGAKILFKEITPQNLVSLSLSQNSRSTTSFTSTPRGA